MDPNVIPFLRPNFGSFIVLLLSLICIGLLIFFMLTCLPNLSVPSFGYSAGGRLRKGLYKLLKRHKISSDEENMPEGDDCS
jgi:hypothetical protein